jgi:hypothetical protein
MCASEFVINALSLGASMIFNSDLILREIDWCASIDTSDHRDPLPLARSRRKASTGHAGQAFTVRRPCRF